MSPGKTDGARSLVRDRLRSAVLVAALLSVAACYPPPPYVNPLPPERVRSLAIRTLTWSPADGNAVSADAKTVRAIVTRKLIERLGDRYRPNRPGDVLTLRIDQLDWTVDRQQGETFHVYVTAQLRDLGLVYRSDGAPWASVGTICCSTRTPDHRFNRPDKIESMAEGQANDIYNDMCSAPGVTDACAAAGHCGARLKTARAGS